MSAGRRIVWYRRIDMTRRTHAIAMLLVMLFVVAACGASFAHAADVATDFCGPAKGWGPAKVDSSASAKPDVDVPAILTASVDVSEPAPRWAGVEDAAPASSRVVLVQSRIPRAPPLA
jgi:uncharacterized protein YfaP (DUF2135 family)